MLKLCAGIMRGHIDCILVERTLQQSNLCLNCLSLEAVVKGLFGSFHDALRREIVVLN